MLDAKGVMEPYQEPRKSGGWLTLVLGTLVFAVFGAVVGYAYFNGLPGLGGEPPVIRADTEPYRRAPGERGGLEVANSSSSIVNVLRPQGEPPRVERLLPPETPVAVEEPEPEPPPALEARPPSPAPTQQAAAPSPPAPPAAAPETPEPAAPARAPVTAAAPEPPASPSVLPAPEALPAPEEPAAGEQTAATPEEVPAPPVGAPIPLVKPAPPQQVAAAEPPARAATPPPSAQRAAAPQRPAAPPQRQARVEPTAPTPPAPSGGSVYRLQLAAVRSDAGLTQAWAQLRQRYAAVLGSVDPRIERVDTTTGPLFRLQAGPFTSREAASNACGSIRAGGGQCFIVGPVAQ